MNTKQIPHKLKLNRNYKYFLFFFMFLFQGISMSFLNASAIYTNSILNNDTNESVFLEAIKSNNLDAVIHLINSGCDVNETTKFGYTPLMSAVYQGNIEIVNLLISAGADLESYDNQGNTPFMYAFYESKEKENIVSFFYR